MVKINAILEHGQFLNRLEDRVSTVVVGSSAKVTDPQDGKVDGAITSLQSLLFTFGAPVCENDEWYIPFSATGGVWVGYVNSEGEGGAFELEAQMEGCVTVELGFTADRVNFDISECVQEAFIDVSVEHLALNEPISAQEESDGPGEPQFSKAAGTNRRGAKSRVEEIDFELIPEGEMQIQEFAGMAIRKVMHRDEWFFSIVDVIEAVSGTGRPAAYWGDLKSKMTQNEGANELFDKIEKLPLIGKDGVKRQSEMGNTETVFRIIQSINSPKAGPFKQWLAKVGYERIQERQNPSIAIKRAIVDYQLQGRSTEWIDARLRTILSRRQLTDEWLSRGINEGLEFAALTDIISKETFGKTTGEHRVHKALSKQHNLRDNMTSVELILTMLGETSTREIAQARNAIGLESNKKAAKAGGTIAGSTRAQLEKELGTSVVSKENNLRQLPAAKELLQFPSGHERTIEAIIEATEKSGKKNKKGKSS